jgi:polyisoprenoid-binding protein YceI
LLYFRQTEKLQLLSVNKLESKMRNTPNAICAIAVLATVVAPASLQAESYIFNSRKSEVRFSYAMGVLTQHGRFSLVEGDLQFDERAPEKSQVFAKIATASIETGQPIVDDELKGTNFFNAKVSPTVTFRSRSVKPTAADAALITGDITVNGITKPVTLDVKVTAHEDPALKHSKGSKQFVAKTKISRSAFKMDSYADMVGDEIVIEIDAIVRPKK